MRRRLGSSWSSLLTLGLGLGAALACSEDPGGDGTGSGGVVGSGSTTGTGGAGAGVGGNGANSGVGGGPSGGSGGGDPGPAGWGPGDGEAGSGGPVPAALAACATTGTIASIGSPWDSFDDDGPDSHGAMYGKKPRLVAAPRGDGSFDFAWQEAEGEEELFITHVAPEGDSYVATHHLTVTSLGQLGGLAIAPGGQPVVVTALSENISGMTEPSEEHRDGVLQLVRIGDDCGEAYRAELRTDVGGNTGALPVYQAFQAGSSRLGLGADRFVLHYAQMTEYDAGVTSRHQIGRFLQGDLATGEVTEVLGSISHSFDQRLVFDGTDFIALALGDASHRGVEISRVTPDGDKTNRNLFSIKGGGGDTGGGYNNTFTRLGQVQVGANGYVSLLSTEAGNVITERVNVSRNLAFLHVPSDFDTVTQDEQYVVTAVDTATENDAAASWDVDITNYWDESFAASNQGVVWITDFDDAALEHAERPKLVRWNDSRFFVLFEKWSLNAFVETMALVVDEYGHEVVAATSLGAVRLSRGDDAFLLGGRAAFLESRDGAVFLHLVDTELGLTTVEL